MLQSAHFDLTAESSSHFLSNGTELLHYKNFSLVLTVVCLLKGIFLVVNLCPRWLVKRKCFIKMLKPFCPPHFTLNSKNLFKTDRCFRIFWCTIFFSLFYPHIAQLSIKHIQTRLYTSSCKTSYKLKLFHNVHFIQFWDVLYVKQLTLPHITNHHKRYRPGKENKIDRICDSLSQI